MLLAAAVGGRSMSDVLRWGQRQDRDDISAGIDVANAPAARDAFESIWRLPDETRSRVYSQVPRVIDAYTDPWGQDAERPATPGQFRPSLPLIALPKVPVR